MFQHDHGPSLQYGYADADPGYGALSIPTFLEDDGCGCDDCQAGDPCPCEGEAAYGSALPGMDMNLGDKGPVVRCPDGSFRPQADCASLRPGYSGPDPSKLKMTAQPAPQRFRNREDYQLWSAQRRADAQRRSQRIRLASYGAIAGAAVIGGLFAWGAGAATAAMGLSTVAGTAAMIAGFALGAVGGWMLLGRMLARMVAG